MPRWILIYDESEDGTITNLRIYNSDKPQVIYPLAKVGRYIEAYNRTKKALEEMDESHRMGDILAFIGEVRRVINDVNSEP